jgi:hypothetical protein
MVAEFDAPTTGAPGADRRCIDGDNPPTVGEIVAKQ